MSVNIFAPCNNLGYGLHSRGLIRGLYTWRKDITLSVIGGVQAKLEPDEAPIIQELSRNGDDFNFKDPSLYIFHEQFGNCFVGSPMCQMPVFETDILDKRSKNMLSQLDHVLVVSKWAKGVLEANGIKQPITVIPEGIEPNIYYPQGMDANRDFTFLTVGKYEVRKSSQEIITAFTQEFDGSTERVRLVAHMANPFMENWLQTLAKLLTDLGYIVEQQTEQKPEITFLRGNQAVVVPVVPMQDRKGMAKMYRSAWCGVFTSKAEGWGLPLSECLACGTPAIVTNCTGQSEYLEAYDERLTIKDLTKQTANDGQWFQGNRGDWYTFTLDELKAKMRWAFENRDEIRKIGTRYSELMRRDFTWNAAGKKLDEFFKGLK